MAAHPFSQDTERRGEDLSINLRHSQVHTVVKRTIGLLKGRWQCHDSTGGMLSYKPEKVCTIVRVCAVPHYMAQLKDVALPPDADRLGPNPDPYLQAFEPNAAAERPRLDVMRCL